MKRARWVRDAAVAGNELHAMKKNITTHNLINIGATLSLVSLFGAVMAAGRWVPWPVYIPLAAILFGSMYFSVFILILHECSHNMFLLLADRERSKRLNRLVGRIAGGVMFTEYVQHWEKGHTIHHLRPCEPDDPQDANPLTGWDLYRLYLLLLIPGYFVVLNPSAKYPGGAKRLVMGVLAWAPVFVAGGFLVGWPVPVAMALGFSVLAALNFTKKAQEHGAGLAHEEDPYLRSRTYLYPLSFLFSPFNINYHFEHHANFNVPWYSLRAYHRKLMGGIVPEVLKPYYFHHEFFAQLAGTKPLPPADLRPLLVGPEDGKAAVIDG